MSLRIYRRPRLVALKPQTPVFEAARAIEENNIGAVVVVDRGGVVGIVTDRDLAVRAVGRALDPAETPVKEVMSSPVTVLSPSDEQGEAIRLMRERNIRRIPLVEDDRLAGMVTLDDLLLDEAAPIEEVSAIVRSQIGEGGPAPTLRAPVAQRRISRAASTYSRFLDQVQAETGLASAEEADTALDVVLTALIRRLTPGEAKDTISQLPSLLHPGLYTLPPGPDKSITRELIESALAERLRVDRSRAAKLLESVGSVIAQNISDGQMKDVRHQLPPSLREIFSPVAARH